MHLVERGPLAARAGWWSAWHGTNVLLVPWILNKGLLPGPAHPSGIYCFKDDLKKKTDFYCHAVRCCPGVFAKIVLHISAKGLWADHEPKVIRGDQWISTEAVVLGMELEVLRADSLRSDEKVLDLDHMLRIPRSEQRAFGAPPLGPCVELSV